ncbi:MAG: PhnA domain-containing protein [Candidatus Gracilibacteria bacterium]|nr:PhnA domain-containing protein [Candidatus Gracilibacteria bacterium]
MSYDYNDKKDSSEERIQPKDSNGNILEAGDSIIAIKDLKVKGGNDVKRGDVFKNIRITSDPEHVESGKMVLKTIFFKKKK